MNLQSTPAYNAKPLVWAGWFLTALVIFGLVASSVMKLLKSPQAIEGFKALGYNENALIWIGIVELVCALIYAFPQTAVLGAILVTGYMGGAVATHVHAQEVFVAPIIIGVLAWLGLYLRDARLRALVPLRF